MRTINASVRPVVTYLFVMAQIGIGLGWMVGLAKAEPAFAALTPFTMMIVKQYFDDRRAEKQAGVPADASTVAAAPPVGMK